MEVWTNSEMKVVKKKYLTDRKVCCMISKVMRMEKFVEQTLLYDFYGELLTEHQRRIYEDMVLNDLSPSEIAKEQGISRQSVHDLKKRCDKILEEYETKLQLVAKFMKIREMIRELDDLADTCAKTRDMALIDQIRKLSGEITATL